MNLLRCTSFGCDRLKARRTAGSTCAVSVHRCLVNVANIRISLVHGDMRYVTGIVHPVRKNAVNMSR